MPGLVEEIQRDALDADVSVTSILRKVKVAASKLRLERVEDWVQNELDGYKGELPDYREVTGRPMAFNPYQGWIPIIMNNDRDNRLLGRCQVRQSISSLEDTVSRATSGHVEMPFPTSIIQMLNRDMDVEFGRMANHMPVTQVQGIIDAVRNLALDWALELERAGITGHGFSFDASERGIAQSGQITYNIGNIANFAGNLGHGNTSHAITANQASNDVEVFDRLAAAINETDMNPEEVSRLQAAVAEMKEARADRVAFTEKYGQFIGLAAAHMTVVAPFLPALTTYLQG